MKKIILIFLTLFIFITDSKALSKFHLAEKVPDMHIESVSNDNIHNGIPFMIRDEDENYVYCLNPFGVLNTTDYYNEYDYNDSIFNLTDEQLNRINLISYYGYGYGDHTDLKWYGITQFLIWKTLDLDDIYFTDENGNKIIVYEEELKEIEDLVKKHLTLPNFANRTFENSVNTTFNLSDYNNVFPFYEVKSSNIDFYFRNNYGYVTTKGEGNYEISFIRKSPIERDYLLYFLNNSQSLIYPGRIDDIEFKVNFVVTSGSITINKIDSENVDRKFATLQGSVYEIYRDNELITTVETNKDGIAYVDNLAWGRTYYIKEKIPSNGYKLDSNTYEIVLSRIDKNGIVNSYGEVIEGNLIINKYYGKENDYKLEDGATFEIYDVNDNLMGAYETENGKINIKLEYGEYYGIQTKWISGYNLVDKFDISISEEKDYIIDLYSEKNQEEILIVEVPDTGKIDYYKFISIIFIIVGLILVIKSIKKTTH